MKNPETGSAAADPGEKGGLIQGGRGARAGEAPPNAASAAKVGRYLPKLS